MKNFWLIPELVKSGLDFVVTPFVIYQNILTYPKYLI